MKRARQGIRTISTLLAICLISSGSSFVFAKTPESAPPAYIKPTEIDAIITKVMEKNKIPGLSISIVFPEGKTFEKSYGSANLEYQIQTETDSAFEIGSISKTFTTIGIMILQEEGKLSVNDKLSKYFPQYPNGEEITIKHLLQHTSGIKNITEVEPFESNQMKDWTPQEIVVVLKPLPLDFEPGQKARYSNSGFILLGLIIEKVTGQSFGEFLQQRITEPLGMANTMLGSNSLIIPKRVAGYVLSGGNLQNAEYASVSAPYASGGIISTAADLVKLKKAFHPGVLLSKESIEEMFTPARLNNGRIAVLPGMGEGYTFGYGLDMLKRGDDFVPGKTGGISGFNAYFVYYRNLDTMVALIANLDNSLIYLVDIANSIADLVEKK